MNKYQEDLKTVVKAHPHAELMLQYAQDAMETDKPWERWEFFSKGISRWVTLPENPAWCIDGQYRRKPKPYEPTLLDQALELEIEAVRLRLKAAPSPDTYFRLYPDFENKLKLRSPAMIEHLKAQGKL